MLEPIKRSYLGAVVGQFDQEIRNLDVDVGYYNGRARRSKQSAWCVRVPAIVCFVIGTLAPFINQIRPDFLGFDTLAVGYLSLALAAALLIIDRISLLTESHIGARTTGVALSLMKQRLLLERDATLPAAENEDTAKALLSSVAKTVTQFATDRASLVRDQTDAWGGARRVAQEEFSQLVNRVREEARTELAQKRAEQVEASRHGALIIAVSYPQDYDETLFIDIDYDKSNIDDVSKKYDGAPAQVAFPKLRPGIVRITAKINPNTMLQDIATIKPDEISSVNLQFR